VFLALLRAGRAVQRSKATTPLACPPAAAESTRLLAGEESCNRRIWLASLPRGVCLFRACYEFPQSPTCRPPCTPCTDLRACDDGLRLSACQYRCPLGTVIDRCCPLSRDPTTAPATVRVLVALSRPAPPVHRGLHGETGFVPGVERLVTAVLERLRDARTATTWIPSSPTLIRSTAASSRESRPGGSSTAPPPGIRGWSLAG
jgi:hypothetical protein